MRIILLTILALTFAGCVDREAKRAAEQAETRALVQKVAAQAREICAPQKHLPSYKECLHRVGYDILDRHFAIQQRHQDRLDAIERDFWQRQFEIYNRPTVYCANCR